MKVTSSKTVVFPTLKWGINAGETKELPTDKEAQKEILSRPYITEAKGSGKSGQVGSDSGDNKSANDEE